MGPWGICDNGWTDGQPRRHSEGRADYPFGRAGDFSDGDGIRAGRECVGPGSGAKDLCVEGAAGAESVDCACVEHCAGEVDGDRVAAGDAAAGGEVLAGTVDAGAAQETFYSR